VESPATEEQTVAIELLPHQYEAVQAEEPYVCLLTGLGGGKTWLGARWLISRAVEFPDSLHLATANSYPQLRDVVIPELLRACDDLGLQYDWRVTHKNLYLHLGDVTAEIRVRSTEKYDLLRGAEYGSWWADEVRDQPRSAVDVVFGRLRCRKVDRPRCLWTTTPNGYDHIYERFVDRADRNYRLIRAVSDDNPYSESLFRTMTFSRLRVALSPWMPPPFPLSSKMNHVIVTSADSTRRIGSAVAPVR